MTNDDRLVYVTHRHWEPRYLAGLQAKAMGGDEEALRDLKIRVFHHPRALDIRFVYDSRNEVPKGTYEPDDSAIQHLLRKPARTSPAPARTSCGLYINLPDLEKRFVREVGWFRGHDPDPEEKLQLLREHFSGLDEKLGSSPNPLKLAGSLFISKVVFYKSAIEYVISQEESAS